jgi:glycosyltransferase involved in cell wall biosynthesis
VPAAAARTLTVAHLIESDGPGGAERVLAYLVSHLAADAALNVVLLPAWGEGWLAKQLPAKNVEVVPIPLLGVSVRCSLQAVTAALRKHQPAVVHSHEFTMSALGGIACWRLGLPHLFTMHGSRYYASRLSRRLVTALAARRAHQVVAVSHSVARSLAADLFLSRARIRVIPNGIPPVPNVVPTLRAELGLSPLVQLIVAVGNLYTVKGHLHLLRAVAMLPERIGGSLHVAIAGRGEEEKSLRALAQSLGIGDRVHLLGLRNDIPNVLRSGTIYALPSLSEALPLSLLEAMRAGLPIVASEVGEIPMVLEYGQAGLLAPPGDSAALADALGTILTDPRRAQTIAARAERTARERYGIEQMADKYLTLYRAFWK